MADDAGSAAAAEVALEAKEYDFVFALVGGALNHSAPDCRLLLCRAAAYLATQQFQHALSDAMLCIEVDPHVARAYLYAASAQLHLRDYAAAAALLDRGLSVEPNNKPMAQLRDVAREAAGSKRMQTPEDLRAMERTAHQVHIEAGDWGIAIEILNEILAIEPTRASARCCRGIAYLGQGRVQDALQEGRWAVHLDETCGEGHELVADAQKATGDLHQALASLRLAQEHGEGCVCTLGLDCLACTLDLKMDGLQRQMEQFDLKPAAEQVSHLVHLAEELHAASGHPANALPQLDRAIELVGTDAQLYCYRSSIYYQIKDEKAAIADAKKAVELMPESCDSQARLGMATMLRLNFAYHPQVMVAYMREAAAAFSRCLHLLATEPTTAAVRAPGIAWCEESITNELARTEREVLKRGAPLCIEGAVPEPPDQPAAKPEETITELLKSRCEVCKTATTVKCSRCKVAFFCSRKCLKEGWYYHKPECAANKIKWEVNQAEARELAEALQVDSPDKGDFDFNGKQRGDCNHDGCECAAFVRRKDDVIRMTLEGAFCERCGHDSEEHEVQAKKTSCTLCFCEGYRHRVGAVPSGFRSRICSSCKHPLSVHETDAARSSREKSENAAFNVRPGPWRLSHMAGWMTDVTIDYKAIEERWSNEPPPVAPKADDGPVFRSTLVVHQPFSTVQLDKTDEYNERCQELREKKKRKDDRLRIEARRLKALKNATSTTLNALEPKVPIATIASE